MSTNSRHLGRGESGCPVPCGAEPDTTFKDQLLLRTYPGTERSSLPTAGVHDLRPGLSDQSPKALIIRPGIIRICFLFTMSWNPQERACRLLAGITHSSETCLDVAAASAIDRNSLVEPDGIEPTTSCLQSTRSPN